MELKALEEFKTPEEFAAELRAVVARTKNNTRAKMRRELRRLVADYLASEGCTCCQGSDHDKHLAALGEYLNVPMYSDGSGYDFSKYRSV